MAFDWLSLIPGILGGGIALWKAWRAGEKEAVIEVLVDAINQSGETIGEGEQQRMKQLVYKRSLDRGIDSKVHQAVKRVERKGERS